nr:hypothetical protein [uncultured bacterium]
MHAQHLVSQAVCGKPPNPACSQVAQSGYHPLSLKSNATFRCTSPSPLFGARLACSTRLQAATGRSGAASGLICIRPYQAGSKLASLLALPPLRLFVRYR